MGDGTFTGISFIAYTDNEKYCDHEKKENDCGKDSDDKRKETHGYGVYVASADLDNDGVDEIITGAEAAPQNPSWVKVFKSDGSETASFLAYPEEIKYGVKVSTGRIGE